MLSCFYIFKLKRQLLCLNGTIHTRILFAHMHKSHFILATKTHIYLKGEQLNDKLKSVTTIEETKNNKNVDHFPRSIDERGGATAQKDRQDEKEGEMRTTS